MVDDAGAFLASGDLSVVQSWERFSPMDSSTGNTMRLMTVLGTDTNQVTASSLEGLPGEIVVVDGNSVWQAGGHVEDIDILHLASELIVDAVIQPENLRDELIKRFALAAGKHREWPEKNNPVTPA